MRINMSRISIENRPLGKKSYMGYKVTSLPDIYADELTKDDFIMVSHLYEDDGVERKFMSCKLKVKDLLSFLETQMSNTLNGRN